MTYQSPTYLKENFIFVKPRESISTMSSVSIGQMEHTQFVSIRSHKAGATAGALYQWRLKRETETHMECVHTD